jgi:hypothetical protein
LSYSGLFGEDIVSLPMPSSPILLILIVLLIYEKFYVYKRFTKLNPQIHMSYEYGARERLKSYIT